MCCLSLNQGYNMVLFGFLIDIWYFCINMSGLLRGRFPPVLRAEGVIDFMAIS